MLAFRSILVPLTAIVGFMLTIVASFGVVTLVFQDGVLASLFGVAQTGPLVSLLPILIIGVVFGLAMALTTSGTRLALGIDGPVPGEHLGHVEGGWP
jgi:uncharacterized membrane protein YdfJ with MMPL/SSD domain